MLTLKIGEKHIETIETAEFVRGTVGEQCQITFEDFWQDDIKNVVFKRVSTGCTTPFVTIAKSQDETLEIPHEILAESGNFKIGVYGVKDNSVLPTLWSEEFKIEYGTDTYGEAPKPPTPSVYEEILKTSQNAVDVANSVREDADNGVFDGQKGDKGDKGDKGEQGIQGQQGEKGEKGDDYILTLEDKQEIADMVDIEVDQTYNPNSHNAQSGVAVAEAINSISEVWEQITNITLEEAAVVNITKDINGNDLSLKKFKILVELPTVTAATTIWLKLNRILAISTQASSTSAANPSYGINAEYTFDWQFLTCTNNTNVTSNSQVYSTPYGHRYAGSDVFSFPAKRIELAINAAFTNGLPSSARIRIWGVKA